MTEHIAGLLNAFINGAAETTSADGRHKERSGRLTSTGIRETKPLAHMAKALRQSQSQYLRTNQFDVAARLRGLVEKFSVLGRDDLSISLEIRLDELGDVTFTRHVPEILALLLELSDRPLENTDLEDLLSDERQHVHDPMPLSWSTLYNDEPESEPGLWMDDGFSALDDTTSDSSEDESIQMIEPGPRNGINSAFEIDQIKSIDLLEGIDDGSLRELDCGAAAVWSDSGQSVTVAETYIMREVLWMLQGMPSSTFSIASQGSPRVLLDHMPWATCSLSQSSVSNALRALAEVGSQLHLVRLWLLREQDGPVMQRLQSAIEGEFRRLRSEFAQLEKQYCCISNSPARAHGLLRLSTHVQEKTRFICRFEALLQRLGVSNASLACLDLLYKEATEANGVMSLDLFIKLREIFADVLNAYLRHIAYWVSTGTLLPSSKGYSIITVAKDDRLARQSRAHILLSMCSIQPQNKPMFMTQSQVNKILNMGLGMRILTSIRASLELSGSDTQRPNLLYMKANADQLEYSFERELKCTLDAWIENHRSRTSEVLLDHLWTKGLFGDHLDSIQLIYLSRDGQLFESLANAVFADLDARCAPKDIVRLSMEVSIWPSPFLLTEAIRDIFAASCKTQRHMISVNTNPNSQSPNSEHDFMLTALSSFHIVYDIPFPLNFIIPSVLPLQSVLSLLLQLARARNAARGISLVTKSTGADRVFLAVRQKLLWFTELMRSYIVTAVIATSLPDLEGDLRAARDLEELQTTFTRFCDRLLANCFLSTRYATLHKALLSILDIAMKFESRHFTKSRLARTSQVTQSVATGCPTLAQLDREFSKLLNFFIAGLRASLKMQSEKGLLHEVLTERLEWGVNQSR